MFAMTILCIITAIIAAIFWCIEFGPIFKEIKSTKAPNWNKIPVLCIPINIVLFIIMVFDIIGRAAPKSLPFILDVICTLTITFSFGLGGLIGTAMGLTISNVISVAIWWTGREEKKICLQVS